MNVQARRVQRFGWKPDIPDGRDRIFKPKFDADSVPLVQDLTPKMPPVYDQLQLGSCTGNGWAAIMEYEAARQGAPMDPVSRLFIYYYERLIEGTAGQDSGAEIRDGAKVVANYGAPPEALWPYSDANPGPFMQEPSQNVQDAAKKLEAIQYKRVEVGGPGAPMRSALAQSFPIVFGFSVPDYFEGSWDPITEPLPPPGASARIIGGHCVVIVGYDFSVRRFKVPVFKCRNSWGPDWGEKGYFYMDYHWFTTSEANAGDMWIVEKVS